jgi:broad specificity phosphatase PhoE
MKQLLFAVLAFSSFALPVAAQGTHETVILVRHAEKAGTPADDPPLTAAGEARARDLWSAIRDAGVSAVITTQFARTRATGQPTASALGLTEIVVPATSPRHVQDVISEISKHSGSTVLVVEHSNTVPAIVEALGARRPSTICDATYDDLFVVTITDGKASAVHGKYGTPSPRDSTCGAMR